MRQTSLPRALLRALRRLFALGLLMAALPLQAQDSGPDLAMKTWGMTQKSRVELQQAEGHPADVVFTNRLTWGHPADIWFEVDLQGLAVDILIRTGDGGTPDLMIVEPPPGYAAFPPSLRVEDGEEGRVEIYPLGWS